MVGSKFHWLLGIRWLSCRTGKVFAIKPISTTLPLFKFYSKKDSARVKKCRFQGRWSSRFSCYRDVTFEAGCIYKDEFDSILTYLSKFSIFFILFSPRFRLRKAVSSRKHGSIQVRFGLPMQSKISREWPQASRPTRVFVSVAIREKLIKLWTLDSCLRL